VLHLCCVLPDSLMLSSDCAPTHGLCFERAVEALRPDLVLACVLSCLVLWGFACRLGRARSPGLRHLRQRVKVSGHRAPYPTPVECSLLCVVIVMLRCLCLLTLTRVSLWTVQCGRAWYPSISMVATVANITECPCSAFSQSTVPSVALVCPLQVLAHGSIGGPATL